jgi:chromosome segregation ATPase
LSKAHITSVEALETFRNALIIFLDKANRALGEVHDQVGRMRAWTQFDQPNHWQTQGRRRKQALEQAEAELFSARLSQWQENEAQLKMIVKRHREALEQAEEKLRRTRKWAVDFDHRVTPLVKKVDTLRVLLEQEMPRALAFLENASDVLHRYTQPTATTRPTPPEPPESAAT